jgi:Ca2+-binding EF-hand superfamily protein
MVHMEEIIKFSKSSKFSKMITSLLIGLRHDSEDISILKDLFHKLDTNNDGTISKEEFEAASDDLHDLHFFNFKDLNWDDVFKEIDLDGDGSVDFHEFCVAAVDHKKLLSTQNLKYVFATLDQDCSGTIELDELKGSLPTSYKRGKSYLETSRDSAYRKAKANLADQPKNGEKKKFFKDA